MTFDEFKKSFRDFLEKSTVNLGRKTALTRRRFIDTAMARFDDFASQQREEDVQEQVAESQSGHMNDRVLCIKPTDRNKALDMGKGVHAMTPSESARADEQLNRSPYGAKTGKQNDKSNSE